jgi:hypothetical protein
LFFAAGPFFAAFLLLDPRLFSSSINENTEGGVCANAIAADKDSGNGNASALNSWGIYISIPVPYFL